MAAAKKNIYIEQGATFRIRFTLKDSSNNAIDLTGYTGRSQLRYNYLTDNIAATFTVAVVDAANGIIELSLSDTITASIDATHTGYKYRYDVELIDNSNIVYRVIEGFAQVSPNITRPSSSSSSG